MELLANYLGNYKKRDNSDNLDGDGPVVISSNNYYAWGDLLTFRYIGEKYFTQNFSITRRSYLIFS